MLQYVICVIFLALIVFLTIFCTCRLRRRKAVENDLLGVDGKVKIRNPDEIILESVENRISDNTHRSLPEIPVTSPISTAYNSSNWANNETNSGNDVTSELYATVATRNVQNSYNVLGRTSSDSEQIPVNVNNLSENGEQPNNAIACSSQNIGAASSAIPSGLIVNQDNPYITTSASERDPGNFSGDSQDSSKGYTSISVREPLAQLRAQTIASNLNDVKHDYATVLDDDAVYAAIDEPENNSVTYDQIDLNAAQREISDAFEEVVAQHSRTESASSSYSLPEVTSRKKTEIRQVSLPITRPPTPPPLPTVQLLTPNVPSTSTNMSDNNNNTSNNIEDMYAKVVKNTGKLNRKPIDNSIEYDQQIVKNDRRNRFQNFNNNECNYESVIDSYSMIGGSSLNSEGDPNYETVRQTNPNYESLIHIEPQYEKLKRKNSTDSNSTDTKND